MDLDELLRQAERQAALKRPPRKVKKNASQDHAERLAEKALYRRLADEANASLDAVRFRYHFDGLEDLSLDQWRSRIDKRIALSKARREKLAGDIQEDT